MIELQDPPRLVDMVEAPSGLRELLGQAQRETLAAADIETIIGAVERRIGVPPTAAAEAVPFHRSTDGFGALWAKHPWLFKWVPTMMGLVLVGGLGITLARRAIGRGDALPLPPQASVDPGVHALSGESNGQRGSTLEQPASTQERLPTEQPPADLPSTTAKARSPTTAAPVSAPPREGTTADPEEYKLLRAARGTLASDPARALTLTEEHRRKYARGMLAQEREAIAIEALARLGRAADAKARHRSFLAQYPQSPYRNRIESALGRSRDTSTLP